MNDQHYTFVKFLGDILFTMLGLGVSVGLALIHEVLAIVFLIVSIVLVIKKINRVDKNKNVDDEE
ncbi:MAG TPA: hypothetical protein VK835_11740 [Bacteroidia bacterium]|jgi:hypothetical protein|nr:hypothetical protein [Bacteroidia bacterium]